MKFLVGSCLILYIVRMRKGGGWGCARSFACTFLRVSISTINKCMRKGGVAQVNLSTQMTCHIVEIRKRGGCIRRFACTCISFGKRLSKGLFW